MSDVTKWVVGVSVAFAIGIMLVAWSRVARQDEWLTGARRVQWRGGVGQPLPESVCGGAPNLGLLSHGVHQWVPCLPSSDYPGGAFARVDVEAQEGLIAWPIPTFRALRHPLGAMPNPFGLVGFVFHGTSDTLSLNLDHYMEPAPTHATGDATQREGWTDQMARTLREQERRYKKGLRAQIDPARAQAPKKKPHRRRFGKRGDEPEKIVAAVAGEQGWVFEPTTIADAEQTRFLGMGWKHDVLEVAVARRAHRGASAAEEVLLVRLLPGGRAVEKVWPRPTLCRDVEGCGSLRAAYLHAGDGTWRVIMDGGQSLWEVTPEGEARDLERPWSPTIVWLAAGQLTVNDELLTESLAPNGTFVDLMTPPLPIQPESRYTDCYRFGAHGLELFPRWRFADTALVQRAGERLAMTEHRKRGAEEALVVSPFEGVPYGKSSPIARARRHYGCGELFRGAFVPRPGGGHWLVTPEGCNVALHQALDRQDGLSVREHLERRGSLMMRWKERRHEWMLSWALFGLPICIVLGALGGWIRERARPLLYTSSVVPGMIIGVLAYIASAFTTLSIVWPLLS
jgi:hypothetical protein